MENLTSDKRVVQDLFEFTGLSYSKNNIDNSFAKLDRGRIRDSGKPSIHDRKIEKLLA